MDDDDLEYEEEDLDDFMENAANILADKNNPERSTIIESLKQHLSSIFQIQQEMENFFNTLNGVIFMTNERGSKNGQKIENKQAFIFYPLVFSFNPRATSYFLDYFLDSIQQSICEENRAYFSFISEVFSDVILSFFSDEKTNKYLIKKSFLLESSKKRNLYEKILKFCKYNIDTNQKVKQSVGCLLLTDFIEKCPMVKGEKHLENLFKIISDYLDDRWFECKLDLLNCTISLIFISEKKFKPYANICLFRVLDYLTDIDWMKRKLAINIVYTLVFYCKEEIMAVKEDIVEFLYRLKEDSVPEVREVCLRTLKYLGEEFEIDDSEYDFNFESENSKPKIMFNKYKNKNNNYTNRNNKIYRNNNTSTHRNNKMNINFNNKNSGQKKMNRSFNEGEMANTQTIGSAKSNKNQNSKNKDVKKVTNPINEKDENLRIRLLKEREFLDKIEKDFNDKKNNFDSKNFNIYSSKIQNDNERNIKKNKKRSKSTEKPKKPKKTLIQKKSEEISDAINTILGQLKKIQDDQIECRKILSNIKQSAGNNYLSLNERLRILERNFYKYNRNYNEAKALKDYRDNKFYRPALNLKNYEENIKIETLKNRFMNGRYNEALIESKENDKYLFKLLPLIDKKVIPKIEIAILEDAIARLNKRMRIICFEEGKEKINSILSFYNQLIRSKIELKYITQINIKDALSFLKSKANNKLNNEDINNIDKIISSLKI